MTKGDSRGIWVIATTALALAASCAEPTTFTPQAPTVPVLRLPRNDVYQGSVLTGSLRPTFTWEASTAPSGPIRYELQYSADRTFAAADVITVPADEPRFQPAANLPVSSVPPVGRRYYWHVRACVQESCSDYSPTWWINLGRSAKDFNGDGYADVIVGGPSFENRGAVSVFFGGAGPMIDITADAFLDDSLAEDHFGRLLSNGDFNGDGFTDAVVSSFSKVHLYLGGPGSFDESPDATFLGEPNALAAGDVNADGFSDLVIGDPSNDDIRPGAGKVVVYYGGTEEGLTVADGAIYGEAQFQEFGANVDAGDINGDGFADIVASSSSFVDEFSPACFADIFFGQAGSSFQSLEKFHLRANTTDYCSSRTVIVGDLDGDGYEDLATGIKKSTYTPQQVEFFRGGGELHEAPDAKIDGVKEGLIYLYAIVRAGDLNGDGYGDIAIRDGYRPVRNRIYMGQPLNRGGGVSAPSAGDVTPAPTAGAGDVNGDGYDDLILGDPTNNLARVCNGGPGVAFDERSCARAMTGTGSFGESVR